MLQAKTFPVAMTSVQFAKHLFMPSIRTHTVTVSQQWYDIHPMKDTRSCAAIKWSILVTNKCTDPNITNSKWWLLLRTWQAEILKFWQTVRKFSTEREKKRNLNSLFGKSELEKTFLGYDPRAGWMKNQLIFKCALLNLHATGLTRWLMSCCLINCSVLN